MQPTNCVQRCNFKAILVRSTIQNISYMIIDVDKASQSKDIVAAKHYWKDFREAKHGKTQ